MRHKWLQKDAKQPQCLANGPQIGKNYKKEEEEGIVAKQPGNQLPTGSVTCAKKIGG